MIDYILPIIIILLLIGFNGFFVSAEFAIVAAQKQKIEKQANAGSKSARKILNLLRNPALQNKYITTAQVGITIVSLGLGMYGEHVFADWIIEPLHKLGNLAEPTAHTIATITSVGLLTFLHVVLGEMIPKSLALQAAERTIMVLYQPMSLVEKLFYPFVSLLNNISTWITRLMGIPPRDINSRLYTPDELEFIVEESFKGGLLEPSDQLFIENILDLEHRTAEQIMTPRNKIHAIPVNANFETVMKLICTSNKTRYPIYESSLDNIIGILHIKDLARLISRKKDKQLSYRIFVRPTIYIPETFRLDDLLIRFRTENHQVAITLDEFGGTAGIVTLEDLVEEVVGEIQDEFDKETPPIEELPGNIIRVRGDVVLGELEQHYKLDWRFSESNTVGGLVMNILGKIPKPNDTVIHQGINIVVESVEGRAVKSLLIYLRNE